MVFDRAGRRIVVYGGTDGKAVFGDLWEFDLEQNRWMALAAGGGDPGSLAYHSAVYDPVAKRMVLFGGSPDRRTVTDAQWSLSLERGREAWVKIESPVAPGPRAAHSAAYDAEKNRMMVFGGCARTLRSCRYTNDVWEMDLTLGAEKWTAIAPLNVPPPERESAAIFIRRSDQALVVTGGFSARGYHRDTWVFNRQERQWKESGEFPGGGRCCAAYQAGEKGLIMFGGNDRRSFFDETWLFGGAKYARRDDPTHPPSRAFATIVPTDEPNLYFLFGGRGNAGALGDFWALKLK